VTAFLTHRVNAQQIGSPHPVEVTVGPGGDLFVVDYNGGLIRRIRYNVGNSPPMAVLGASPDNGPVPLTVQFDGAGSSDPDQGATLYYAWDLDGDGEYDDATLPQAERIYDQIGDVTIGLRVTDDDGAVTTATRVISAGNAHPVATIVAPEASFTWHVGEVILYEGTGVDTTDGAMPATAMSWDIVLHHCIAGPGTCHEHDIETIPGVDQGSFTAPDHEYYTELEFRFTVTDSGGLSDTASVTLTPEAAVNDFTTAPDGLTLSVAGTEEVTPFSRPAIAGSLVSLVAPTPQTLAGADYYFVGWDDGGDAGRSFVAASTPLVFHATFAPCVTTELCDGVDDDCDGVVDNAPPPVGPIVLTVDTASIAWTAAGDALTYDLVRGRLGAAGVVPFLPGQVDACVTAATSDIAIPFTLDPSEGEGWWFLVRGHNCGGAGSWDSGDPAQVGSRDAGVNSSPAVCP